MGFDTSGVSPAGPDYHSSFVGASNRALFSLGCSSFSRTGHVDRISAELSPIHPPAAVYFFLSPLYHFLDPGIVSNSCLGPAMFSYQTRALLSCVSSVPSSS